MKRRRNCGGAFEIHKISPTNYIDILSSFENGNRFHGKGKRITLRLRSGEIKVKKVVIPRMINGEKKAKNPIGIAIGSGYEISD